MQIIGWLVNLNDNKEYELDNLAHRGNFVIGRKAKTTPSQVNIPIETTDETVSRMHCKIESSRGKEGTLYFKITDLGSTNSTKLLYQGDPSRMLVLEKGDIVYLNDRDEIVLGQTKLRLKLPTGPTG